MSQAQNALAKLRSWNLRRDDTSDDGGRLYWDEQGNKYFSVTRILSETSPEHQKKRLQAWLERPSSELERSMAAQRGTDAHNHCEYVLKTAQKLARNAANKRNSYRTGIDGLERPPTAITKWALHKAVENAPSASWSSSGYARGLRTWIVENATALHATEFSVAASLRPRTDGTYELLSSAQAREAALAGDRVMSFAGSCDALLDYKGILTCADWKTSKASIHQSEEQKLERLHNYRHQLGAYSLGLRHGTGLEVPQAAIVLARRTGAPEVTLMGSEELREAEQAFLERVARFHAAQSSAPTELPPAN